MQIVQAIIYAHATEDEGDEVLQLQVDTMKEWCKNNRGPKGLNLRAEVVAVFHDICPKEECSREGLSNAIAALDMHQNSLLLVWSMQRLGLAYLRFLK